MGKVYVYCPASRGLGARTLDQYHVEHPRKDGIETDLRLTQVELATCVAATRESVNKVLGSFRDQGLITIEDQTITILDKPGRQTRINY